MYMCIECKPVKTEYRLKTGKQEQKSVSEILKMLIAFLYLMNSYNTYHKLILNIIQEKKSKL